MKALPSTILQDGKPVDDDLDLAFIFAHVNKPAFENFIEQQNESLRLIEERIQSLRHKKVYLPGVVVAIVSLFLLFLKIFYLGIPGLIGGGVWVYLARQKQQKDINLQEAEKQKVLAQSAPQTVSHLGKVHYVVQAAPFEDGQIILDVTGILPKQAFSYTKIPDGTARLQNLVGLVSQIPEELPILLPANAPADLSEELRLRGIEADIEQGLSLCDRIFADTADIKAELPTFTADDDLVKALRQLSGYLKEDQPAVQLRQMDPDIERAVSHLEQISKEAVKVKALGAENTEILMSTVVGRMDAYITRFKQARDHSLLDILSQGLDSLKPLYDYPLTRFYCPKCHQVEPYRQSLLPVPLHQLMETPMETLSPFYRSQELIHLRGLADTIRRYFTQVHRMGEDTTAEHFTLLQEKLRSYEERMRELAVEIEGLDPKIEVHRRNAVLKFNTLRKTWICQLCQENFSEEQAHWARMLKIKDDLIFPMWDCLWMEKHDERNRIIREKETELRSNKEKEASQLREEAKVFTEEYRAVRNQLEEAGSGYTVSTQQLQMMLEFFASRGILSQETSVAMQNYLSSGGDQIISVNETVTTTDALELQLEQEPDTVFIRRGQLMDYADEIRNADKYWVVPTQNPKALII